MKKLRPYQKAAARAGLSAINANRSGLIHIATGGGKTVVASELVRKLCQSSEGYVLWLTKDWTLLAQAARSVARQAPDLVLGRLGGEKSPIAHLADQPDNVDVLFTTLHTFTRRVSDLPYASGPELVVWDECHWGEGSPMGRGVAKFASHNGAPILGLTATPRGSSKLPTLHRTTFRELVELGHLAKPVIVAPIQTGVAWTPERTSEEGDFTAASLRELGENDERNELIVNHWRTHARRYGPTIVFACNIDHAEELSALFKDAGASVGVVHCGLDGEVNQEEIASYKSGALDVLINVAMLTHGFDAPKTQTIFLTRPTASFVLYAQMIGRGSRVAPGKEEFFIVEFTDNVQAHHESVLHPDMFLYDEPRRGGGQSRRKRFEKFEHRFDPGGRLMNIGDPKGIDALIGLRYRKGQTFGIELELTRAGFDSLSREEWEKTATAILSLLQNALPSGRVAALPYYTHGDPDRSFDVWNVERDSSCGWEIVGPKLEGLTGFREIATACNALAGVSALGLSVNHRTGFHVHLGWTGKYRSVQHVLAGAHQLEPMLASIVAPSRVADYSEGSYNKDESNYYCAPLASVRDLRLLIAAESANRFDEILERLDEDENRYTTVNVIPMRRQSTVEIRMHGGTIESTKILLWISLWMQLLQKYEAISATGVPPKGVKKRDVIQPEGCLVSWLQDNLTNVPAEFLERIEARRQEILRLWNANRELRQWTLTASNWRAPGELPNAAE